LRLTTTDIAPASCFSGAIVSIITRMRCVEKRIEGTIVDAEADSLDNVNINEPCLLQFLLTLGDDIVTSVDSVIDDSSTSSGAGVRISHRGQTRRAAGVKRYELGRDDTIASNQPNRTDCGRRGRVRARDLIRGRA
jgi:hypothetical protein